MLFVCTSATDSAQSKQAEQSVVVDFVSFTLKM